MRTATETPLTPREAIRLLGRMDLVEYSLEAAACGDQGGPLTSSPVQRANIARVLRRLGEDFESLADVIDPQVDSARLFSLPEEGKRPGFPGGAHPGQAWPIQIGLICGHLNRVAPAAGGADWLDLPELSACRRYIELLDADAREAWREIAAKQEPADGKDTTSRPSAGAGSPEENPNQGKDTTR